MTLLYLEDVITLSSNILYSVALVSFPPLNFAGLLDGIVNSWKMKVIIKALNKSKFVPSFMKIRHLV
jgi:hypothetical protein